MRIQRVLLRGFGPFPHEQSVDIDAVGRDGIFLISGRTGAGKSSILDAIAFGLYGTIPRYSEDMTRVRSGFASEEDDTFVAVNFTHGEQEYRIERSPSYERRKRSGAGTTSRSATADLLRRDGDEWTALAHGPRDVALAFGELFPLTAGQFFQVVMLAQNDFQRFLRADSEERRRLLATLFRTGRFADLTERVVQRAARERAIADAHANALASARDQLAHLTAPSDPVDDASTGEPPEAEKNPEEEPDENGSAESRAESRREVKAKAEAEAEGPPTQDVPPEELLARLRTNRIEAMRRRDEAAVAAARARAELHEAQQGNELHERRARLESELDALAAERPRIDERIGAVRLHRTASTLLPLVDLAEQARSRASDAENRAREAADREVRYADEIRATIDGARSGSTAAIPDNDAAHTDASESALRQLLIDSTVASSFLSRSSASATTPAPDTPDAAEAARVRADGLSELAGAASSALSLDDAIGAARDALAAADDAVEEAERLRTAAVAAASERPARVEALGRERDRLRGIVAARPGAEAALSAALRARDATGSRERARADVDAAAAGLTESLEGQRKAVDDERTLLELRHTGAAAELAATLVDDGPCPVCGSTSHPQPARHEQVRAVSTDDLDRAAAATHEATLVTDRDRSAWNTAHSEFTRLDTLAGGLSIDQAQAAWESARAQLDAIEAADRDLIGVDTYIVRETAARDADSARITELTSRLSAAERERATARERAENRRIRHDIARGSWPTVAARLDALTAQRDAARATAAALSHALSAATTAAESMAELDAGLEAASELPDAEAVRRAYLDRTALAHEEAAIDRHTERTTAVRSGLSSPELTDLPDEAVDLAAVRENAERSAARLADCDQRLGAAERVLDLSSELVTTIRSREQEHAEAEASWRRIDDLAGQLRGGNNLRRSLEAFVLSGYLEDIVAAANSRLRGMTSHRYRLQVDEDLARRNRQSGLGLKIDDAHTGKARDPESLSGGETFLVSMALALGLADTVTERAGGIDLDTLFIDEGFGSLDHDTLEVAMRTLDQLRASGRTIGLISHVSEMQAEIPARVEVRARREGGSVILTP